MSRTEFDPQTFRQLSMDLEELEQEMLLRLQTIRRALRHAAGEEPPPRKAIEWRNPISGKKRKIQYHPID